MQERWLSVEEIAALLGVTRDKLTAAYFERVRASDYPVRGCLFSLKSLEPVRIIEAEK